MTTPETLSLYFVITLQWVTGPGSFATTTQTGPVSAPADATRGQLVDYLLNLARQGANIPADTPATVLFLSIDHNQLTDPAPASSTSLL